LHNGVIMIKYDRPGVG